MTVVPSSTSTLRPSMSTVGMRVRLRAIAGTARRTTAPSARVLLELGAELRDEAAHRHRGRVGERADGVAHHVVRDVEQQVDVAGVAPPVLEAR